MIDRLFVLFLNGIMYIRKHPQLLMTLLLLIVIPIAFIFSGQQFLGAGQDNQERLEKDRIGLLQDMFASILSVSDFSPTVAQEEIVAIANANPDIKAFTVSKETAEGIAIIASLQSDEIEAISESPEIYRFSNAHPGETILQAHVEDFTRHWVGVRAVKSSSNETYYIYTKTSLRHIDDLFSDRITKAYYWLGAILLVVFLLLFRHVRLIDYAHLYSETKKANEMKDLFTNMIAHELRTPLTSMRGYASLIHQKNSVSNEIKEFALRIEESSGRLVLIVNDLLDVARIQSGKLSITKAKLNIKTLITSVVENQNFLAKEKGIKIATEEIPDVYITGDEKRLYQAFTNLVSNSIKYTKAGTITLSVEDRSDRLEVRVKDTGVGMSAENQKNLFAPFFRIENTDTKNVVGTGLGMWITKQLIELMSGSIAVESIKGVGTHVVVTLPK